MPRLTFVAEIEGPAEEIFAAIADLTGYHRWLDGSNSFGGITEISPLPIGLGTTYVDAGPAGTRHGSIVAYEPPKKIAFHQPMRTSGPLRGNIDIDVCCTLEPGERTTRVTRDVTIAPRGILILAQPLVMSAFRRENERLLLALKRHVEGG